MSRTGRRLLPRLPGTLPILVRPLAGRFAARERDGTLAVEVWSERTGASVADAETAVPDPAPQITSSTGVCSRPNASETAS